MVSQAIIPLAGLGTRLLPLSSVIPKELLPINGKPNLEYIMEECIQAGIRQFIFVVPKNRPSIKKYFFNDKFYKKIIKKKRNDKRLKLVFKKIKHSNCFLRNFSVTCVIYCLTTSIFCFIQSDCKFENLPSKLCIYCEKKVRIFKCFWRVVILRNWTRCYVVIL